MQTCSSTSAGNRAVPCPFSCTCMALATVGIASMSNMVCCCLGVPKGAMLTHGNLVADSAGMIRATYVAPGIVQTAYGTEESVPGNLAGCMILPAAAATMTDATQNKAFKQGMSVHPQMHAQSGCMLLLQHDQLGQALEYNVFANMVRSASDSLNTQQGCAMQVTDTSPTCLWHTYTSGSLRFLLRTERYQLASTGVIPHLLTERLHCI